MKKTKKRQEVQRVWVCASFCVEIPAGINLLDGDVVRCAIGKEMAKGWGDEEFGSCAVDDWMEYQQAMKAGVLTAHFDTDPVPDFAPILPGKHEEAV